MKKLLTVLLLGIALNMNAQTYMYINEGHITPESPVSTTDMVSLQLLGDFSNGGSYVVDYEVTLDGFTVNFEINAASDGGIATLVPFDLTYELGTYPPGEYTVEITGTGIGVSIEDPLTFIVEEDEPTVIVCFGEGPEFLIYPNPAAELLMIDFRNWENHSLEILSNESKIIRQVQLSNAHTSLPIADLANGHYFIRIIDPFGQAVRVERFVVTD